MVTVDNRVEWIFFDVDQTLCDFASMMRRALGRSIVEIERRWPSLTGRFLPEDLEEIRNRHAAAYTDGPVPLVAVRRAMFSTALAGMATESEVDEITEDYLRHRFADPAIFPDVVPALRQLSAAGTKLGVVTNGNSKLDSLGLTQFFAAEFVAERVGFAKPDPRIYHHVAEVIGVDPQSLLMVGDSYHNDVVAARNAGWQAIWVDRCGEGRHDHSDRCDRVTDLRGLLRP